MFVDDGLNPYRTMCFTIAAKFVKKRGAEVGDHRAGPAGEAPHAKVVELVPQPKSRIQQPCEPKVRKIAYASCTISATERFG